MYKFAELYPVRRSTAGAIYAIVAIACCSLGYSSFGEAAERPNILYVVTDDVGLGDIKSYNADGKVVLPTIERLAQEGIRFTDAHTSAAKCAPSRYSIITGNYHWRGRKSWGQWNYKGGSQILAGQQTLGDMLKRAGYATAIIGKYHLGAEFYRKNSDEFVAESNSDNLVDFARPMSDGPADHGFDHSFLALRGIQASPYAFFSDGSLFGSVDDLITWEVGDYGDTRIDMAGIGLSSWVTRDVGPTLLGQALDFIDAHDRAQSSAQTAAPFFLYFNNQAVHSPWKAPVSIGQMSILGMSGMTERTDLLIETDAILDQILLALEARDLLDDTLIIVTSDNGGLRIPQEQNAGHLVSGGFRGDKGTIYEGGHRVPLILKWGPQSFGPSPLPQGTVSDAHVGVQDLYATLAEMVGVQLGQGEALDSISFLPILMGQQTDAIRDHMIYEADAPEDNAPDGGISGRHFAYRSEQFKLIFDSNGSAVGLYDLGSDPAESINLVGRAEQQARITAMRADFNATRASERTAPPPSTNVHPTVSITEPASGSQLTLSNSVVFRGTGSDSEDGPLSQSIAWRSSIEGDLGTGESISISNLGLGTHSITATVIDSSGATTSDIIDVTITSAPPPPSPPPPPPPSNSSGGGAIDVLGLLWLGLFVLLRGKAFGASTLRHERPERYKD